jgi:hypothetical protein
MNDASSGVLSAIARLQTAAIAAALLSLILAENGNAADAVVLLSGGPCVYEPTDTEHDQSWDNYVSAPLYAWDANRIGLSRPQHVFWFVFKPAYDQRWLDDLKATDFRQRHVANAKKDNFNSYVDKIKSAAKKRGWHLIWVHSAADFWQALGALKVSVDEFYYWGHARGDLWLGLDHQFDPIDQKMIAVMPDPRFVVSTTPNPAHVNLRSLFQSTEPQIEFFGCNTAPFAQSWANLLDVTTYGYDGKVDFSQVYYNGGQVLTTDPKTGVVIGTRVECKPERPKLTPQQIISLP